MSRICWIACITLFVVAPTTSLAQPLDYLPSIPKGTIAVRLRTVATGMAAPDYGISPPGDTSRLFVVEQNGLLRIFRTGDELAPRKRARHSESRVARHGSVQPGQRQRRARASWAWRFIRGSTTRKQSRVSHAVHLLPAKPLRVGTQPIYIAPNNATQNYKHVVNEWKMSADRPERGRPDVAARDHFVRQERGQSQRRHDRVRSGDGYLYLALGDGGNANDVGASHIEPGGNAQNLTTPLGKMLRIDPLQPGADARQRERREHQRPVPHSRPTIRSTHAARRPGDLRLRVAKSVSVRVRSRQTATS